MASKAVLLLALLLLAAVACFPVEAKARRGGRGAAAGGKGVPGGGGAAAGGKGVPGLPGGGGAPGGVPGGGNLQPWECSNKCASRCSRTQYHKACVTFCNKCCATCLCVPPGFYGNKGACPCYNNWKTKEGGPKCP